MRPGYHDNARLDVLPWLPETAQSCFDLGCGSGGTLQLLRKKYPDAKLAGLEMDAASAEIARQLTDDIWCADADKFIFADHMAAASLDLILCLDVLEHLVDPWAIIRQLSPLLRPGGRIIASIPNIRYHKVVKNLVLDGTFEYTDFGSLDRTHLRFFVRETAERLVAAGGLKIRSTASAFPIKRKGWKGFANWCLRGRLDDFLIMQYMIVAQAPES